MRVLIVKDRRTKKFVKVCENHRAFRQWLDNTMWDRSQVTLSDRMVREEQ